MQTMKSVKCSKLVIDRAKSKAVGILKDISLVGNFSFPKTGEYANGLWARSIAGIGKMISKTKEQLQSLSKRKEPIAGATGATVSEEMWTTVDQSVAAEGNVANPEAYTIMFMQSATEEPATAQLRADSGTSVKQPNTGYAIKKGGAKRVTFSSEQKEIMISFYNRQKSSQIRADPDRVIEAMKQAGVPTLTKTQIKSWWSTYHRKQKQLTEDLLEEARQIRCSAGT